MADPIIVRTNQGGLDTFTAAGRLLVVVLSTAPAAALFLRKGDLIGLYNFFQTNQGAALLGALAGLASIAYGLYKSFKRGKQVADVATDPEVPEHVATTK
jgi:uncharacterized membrane protein YebE (DUF533 family)